MSVRRRLTATLFAGSALGTTAYLAAVTVSGLVVEEITGQAALAGVPAAMGTTGTAVGTFLLTLGIARRGRRPGLIAGYILGAVGALATVAAVVWGSLWLLLAGMAMLGFGHASNQLARYTAAEMFPADRRASALSMIVWAGTIGSVLGPSLLEPGGRVTTDQGWSDLAGGSLVAIVFMGAAGSSTPSPSDPIPPN
ncbi:MAG: MFS transporter [Acidimicrobiia bacterium]|nr:MFS transporter [Acidimicrobiia bacterium]